MAETAEQVQETTETKQIYDINLGKYVDMPGEKKEEKAPESEEETEEEEETTDEVKDEKKEEEKEEEAEKEESEEEKEEQAEEEFDSVTPDDFIKNVFGEKYEVQSQEELEELIENAAGVMENYEALQKQVAELKDQKPKFGSQEEEKAFEFIKKFGVPRQGEAFQTYAKLIAMDVDNADPRMLLEERFVHENPELTREEAQRKFARDFNRKYTLSRESFDGTDAEYKEEVEMLEIDKKSEVNKAKKFLKEQQEKFKPTAKEEGPKVPEVVQKSIEKNVSSYESFTKDNQELVFEESGEKVSFKLDKDKSSTISKAMMAWVKNPANYDEKGNLVGVKNMQDMQRQVAGAVFLNDIIKAAVSQVKNSVSGKRIDEVAEKKPDKGKSVSGAKFKKEPDLYDSAAELIRKRQKA